MFSVSEALRTQRELAGLGVDEVCQACGISEEVYRFEAMNDDLEYWCAVLSNSIIEFNVSSRDLVSDLEDESVGQRVWRIRVDSGPKQGLVADRIGMSEDHYSRIEEGLSPLETYAPFMTRFSGYLGVPIEYLITPEGRD